MKEDWYHSAPTITYTDDVVRIFGVKLSLNFAYMRARHAAHYLRTGFEESKDRNLLESPHYLALPLSREFPSLKAYMLLWAYGREKYSRLIQQNLNQAISLAKLVTDDPELELTAPVAINVVCLRFNPGVLSEVELGKLNKEIANNINKINFWMTGDTMIKGRFTLSARAHFEYIHKLVIELAKRSLRFEEEIVRACIIRI